MMQQLSLSADDDTTSLSYWLNWRVFLCATWILVPMVVAVFVIRKYEGLDHLGSSSGKIQHGKPLLSYSDAVWKPCFEQIHPIWLLIYRVLAFCFLLATLAVKLNSNGARMYFYYTQWTYTLVTVYFALGSLLSVYGCFRFHKLRHQGSGLYHERIDSEQDYNAPLITNEASDVHEIGKRTHNGEETYVHEVPTIYYIFQIIYQICAGSVMYTDCIYWFIIFPFLNIQDYKLNFITVDMHSINAVLLIGDMAMNRLPFPWFRISYFILWTGAFALFQWAVHACENIWWPYPFFDLASPNAPYWYLLMATLSVTCYGIYVLIFSLKHKVFSKCFPGSYHCLT